jgi:uncharacterized protein
MKVSLVWSPAPRQVIEDSVEVPDGATVATALARSGWTERFGFASMPDLSFGVWNLPASLKTPLREFDRVEVYRPLTADPKEARRKRFSKQGSKAAGLFANKRPGAKAGY